MEKSELTREKIREELGEAPWKALKSHAKRDHLILIGQELDLVEVSWAIAQDQADQVGAWIQDGTLRKPQREEWDSYEDGGAAVFQFVVLQPFVVAKRLVD